MIPLNDALGILVVVAVAIFCVGWFGRGTWERSAEPEDDWTERDRAWKAEFSQPLRQSAVTGDCPIQAVFGADEILDCTFPAGHAPGHSWAGVHVGPYVTAEEPEFSCEVCRDTGQVWSPEPDGTGMYDEACPACDMPYPVGVSAGGEDPWALQAAEPDPPSLDPDTDRMPTIAELADNAEYRLAWTELDGLVRGAHKWYEETWHTGSFRAVR